MTTVTKEQVIKLQGNKTLNVEKMWIDRLNILLGQVLNGEIIVHHMDATSFSYTIIEKNITDSKDNNNYEV